MMIGAIGRQAIASSAPTAIIEASHVTEFTLFTCFGHNLLLVNRNLRRLIIRRFPVQG